MGAAPASRLEVVAEAAGEGGGLAGLAAEESQWEEAGWAVADHPGCLQRGRRGSEGVAPESRQNPHTHTHTHWAWLTAPRRLPLAPPLLGDIPSECQPVSGGSRKQWTQAEGRTQFPGLQEHSEGLGWTLSVALTLHTGPEGTSPGRLFLGRA